MQECISIFDTIGVNKDALMEILTDLYMCFAHGKDLYASEIDTKTKTAFTRMYNSNGAQQHHHFQAGIVSADILAFKVGGKRTALGGGGASKSKKNAGVAEGGSLKTSLGEGDDEEMEGDGSDAEDISSDGDNKKNSANKKGNAKTASPANNKPVAAAASSSRGGGGSSSARGGGRGRGKGTRGGATR